MGKHLVLAGGGHAHMMTLEHIGAAVAKGHRVTVIGPSDFHYYSGMGPGMLGGTYSPDDIRFATRRVVEGQGGQFIRDYVSAIDPENRTVVTKNGSRVGYDVLSCNAGSHIPMEAVEDSGRGTIYPVKPIEKLWEAREKLLNILTEKSDAVVSVVGGGPSSAEVAGNVWQLAQRMKTRPHPVIRIFSRGRFMARFSQGVRNRVRRILDNRGVAIMEGQAVEKADGDGIETANGQHFPTDFTFMASGVRPSALFEASGLAVGPDKGLLVNPYLQSTSFPEIFGGGDCIHFKDHPLDKVGVYAVRENPILLHNLMAALEGGELKAFDPGPDYLLIFNLGGGQGVLKKRWVEFGGRLAFKVKDYIDRRFMKQFQAIEKPLSSTGRSGIK